MSFLEEQQAIDAALDAGKQYGYGNIITRLQTAWKCHLMLKCGMDEKTAEGGALMPANYQRRIDALKTELEEFEELIVALLLTSQDDMNGYTMVQTHMLDMLRNRINRHLPKSNEERKL